MNNVAIEGISDLNVVTNLFSQLGEFHKNLDYKKEIAFNTNTYAGFLVNVISTGIGVIPLKNSGQMLPKKHKLIPYQEANFNKLAARM